MGLLKFEFQKGIHVSPYTTYNHFPKIHGPVTDVSGGGQHVSPCQLLSVTLAEHLIHV